MSLSCRYELVEEVFAQNEQRPDKPLWRCAYCGKTYRRNRVPLAQRCSGLSIGDVGGTRRVIVAAEPQRVVPQTPVDEVMAERREQIEEAARELGLLEENGKLIKEAYHYGKALIAWQRAGKPRRTAEQVSRLHAICEQCPGNHFKGVESAGWLKTLVAKVGGLSKERGYCELCGCAVAKGQGLDATNKAAMGTEDCLARADAAKQGYWRAGIPREEWAEFWPCG